MALLPWQMYFLKIGVSGEKGNWYDLALLYRFSFFFLSLQVGPNILQFLTHVWVQPEDLDSLLDHYVRERWGVPTIETFVPDPRPTNQNKV